MRRLAFLLPALSLCAQDPWLDHWSAYRPPWGGAPGWVLASTGTANPPTPDEVLLKLRYGQDIDLPRLSAAVAQALLKRESLPITTAWVLLSPDGEVKASGPGSPSGEAILGHLRRNGLTPRWERREAFLKDHPGHGEARAEALEEALRLAQFRLQQARQGGKIPQALPDQVLPECELPNSEAGAALAKKILADVKEPLDAWLAVPGWEFSGSPNLLMASSQNLWRLGAVLVPELQSSLDQLRQELARQLERDPVQNVSAFALGRLGEPGARALQELVRQRWEDPDRPWPTPWLVTVLGRTYPFLGEGSVLDTLENLGSGDFPRHAPENWEAFLRFRKLLLQQRLPLKARRELWDGVVADLAELRRLEGSAWEPGGKELLRNQSKARSQAQVKEALELPPLPDLPAPPPLPPLRLILVGKAPWLTRWLSLKDAAPLALWAPSELRWEVADQGLAATLQSKFSWDEAPRWALLREDVLLASGPTCPNPEALAAQLTAQGPSRLQRLATYLERNPEHRNVRRARVELLRTRLPNPALEALMVEDARRLATGVDISPIAGWTPDPALWEWAAQRTLPQLEATLQRWPSDVRTWWSWIAWSRYHPSRPSALALVQRLPLWRDRDAWAAALPKDVHLAVAEEFRQQGRFEDMRAWFQNAWESLDRRPLSAQAARMRNWYQGQLKDWELAIVKPLREALTVLRRDAELLTLEKTWAAMQGKEGKR